MDDKQYKYFVIATRILLYASITYLSSTILLGIAFLLFGEGLIIISIALLLLPVLMVSLPLIFISLIASFILGSFRPNDRMIMSSERIVPEINNNFFGWMMTAYVFDFDKTAKGDIVQGLILPRMIPRIGIVGISCLYLGLFFIVSGVTGIFNVSEVHPNIRYGLFGLGIIILLPFYIAYKIFVVRKKAK
ncbi:MAG: hypothetical protein ACMXYL_00260 [Candidatus Woesearchaeota archaeon]